jgi:protein-disulfide isomerase/uncharacterized membrane protein
MKRFVLLLLVVMLSTAGLVVTFYLVKDHLNVYGGGMAEGLFCGASDKFRLAAARFDCNQVAAHESSWLLGWPLAVWGLAFYIVVAGLALSAVVLRGEDRKAVCAFGAVLCTMAFLFDLYLGTVMVVQIGHVCLNCVATYAINLLLAVFFRLLDKGLTVPLSWARLFPSIRELWRGDDATYYCSIAKSGVWLLSGLAMGVSLNVASRELGEIRQWGESETERFVSKFGKAPDVDMARFSGQPARGPDDAAITMVLAGDFQCNVCRSLANHVERIAARLPFGVRTVYVNSPISSLCNPAIGDVGHADACWLAEGGECAAAQGRFWEYHDFLYERVPHPQVSKAVVLARLSEIGLDEVQWQSCMTRGEARTAVQSDIALCGELGLTATPSVVINGYLKRGSFFPWMLERVIGKMLARDVPRLPSEIPSGDSTP